MCYSANLENRTDIRSILPKARVVNTSVKSTALFNKGYCCTYVSYMRSLKREADRERERERDRRRKRELSFSV